MNKFFHCSNILFQGSKKFLNTLQPVHSSILSSQEWWAFPLHLVPLMNQHRSPELNSKAGQFFRRLSEQFNMSQHLSLSFPWFIKALEKRNRSWRSTWWG